MSYPGEYPQPLLRKTVVNVPVVSGYVTARLQAVDPVQPSVSGDDTYALVLFENVGNTACHVMLQQTTDRTVSGTRFSVVSGIALVPGGRRTIATNAPYQRYLELKCTFNGPSQIRMQIESQRQWNLMVFDKVADATFYPTSLWQASPTDNGAAVSQPSN